MNLPSQRQENLAAFLRTKYQPGVSQNYIIMAFSDTVYPLMFREKCAAPHSAFHASEAHLFIQ